MTFDATFTEPSPEIATARRALARLQLHLDECLDPLDETVIATDLAFALLGLEEVDPPYPPLPHDLEPSLDPRGDYAAALAAVLAASSMATTARETLRFAYVVRDLRAMESDPAFATAIVGDERCW